MRRILNYLASPLPIRILLLVLALIAVATFPLAKALSPWIRAAQAPVEVRMEAPLTDRATITAGPGEEVLRLVPVPNADQSTANLWLAELPARPEYHLTVSFPGPVSRVRLMSIKLIDPRDTKNPVYFHNSISVDPWFSTDQVSIVRHADNFFALQPQVGGSITITSIFNRQPPDVTRATIRLWLYLILIVYLAFLLVVPLFQSSALDLSAILPAKQHPGLVVWIAFFVATTIHITLICHSPVVIAGGDTMIYLAKAVDIARHGQYLAGGWEFELNRLPGYPLLLTILLKTIGYHIQRIAIAQGIFFCFSILILYRALRRWIHPWIGAATIVVAILSPAEVWASRTMLAESSMASFTALSVAALAMYVQSHGRRAVGWMFVFALLAAFAVFIRPNAICIYFALIPVFIPQLLRITRDAMDKIRALIGLALLYAMPLLILVASMLAWSIRNFQSRGYFGASDMTGVTLVCGLMVSGIFDSGSVQDPKLYDELILHQQHNGYYYAGFDLRHEIVVNLTNNGRNITRTSLIVTDRTLRDVAARSKSISPWQLRLIGLLRSSWWAEVWPDVNGYTQQGIRLDYVTFENTSATRRGFRNPSPEAQQKLVASIHPRFVYDIIRPNGWFNAFSHFAELYYDGWYITLTILAGISAVVTIRRTAFPAALIYIFIANIAINVYLLNVFSRYIHTLDMLLAMQIAIGATVLVKRKKSLN